MAQRALKKQKKSALKGQPPKSTSGCSWDIVLIVCCRGVAAPPAKDGTGPVIATFPGFHDGACNCDECFEQPNRVKNALVPAANKRMPKAPSLL